MEIDDKLRWLEARIVSSLRPRNEDLKNMFSNDENRLAFHEFINNEDVRKLFVYIQPPRHVIAALQAPADVSAKSIFFLKNNAGVKLTKDNMDDEVMYIDCTHDSLEQVDMVTREVYLPLLCTDQAHVGAYGISADKMMDMLHRLMAHMETTHGHIQGELTLPLPSIEVLADAAGNPNRRQSVLHVLETTVIGWIKQIKSILKHSPMAELHQQAGPYPGPLDEVALWRNRLIKLQSIMQQLESPVATDILRNLEEADSNYAHSFQMVLKDISKAIVDTKENLLYLSTMTEWFEDLHSCLDPAIMLKHFAPLIHILMLVWKQSKYYHQPDNFHNLLRLISNEVVHRAEAMVGEDVLREPLKSYSKLKEALRVCAAFRGTYLDYRDKAQDLNDQNQQEHAEKMIQRPQGPYILFSTRMYGQNAYQPRYGAQGRTSAEDEEALREEELFKNSPWPPRNAPAFDLLNSFMERCNDVLELVQTTRHFRLLSDAAEVGGAGSQSLDALVKEIHANYTEAMEEFFRSVKNVLDIDGTQAFERAFFKFRTVVKDLERKLSDVLRQSFNQCPTIGAQLRLLAVFEGISSRELVQAHLHDKDTALVRSFTAELLSVRSMFQMHRKQPPLHKNMPPAVSKLFWVRALKSRVEDPMSMMKKVSPHSLDGDKGWQLREAYMDCMKDFEEYESMISTEWQRNIVSELTERLKQPLLIADDYDEEEEIRPQTVHVNLDPQLLVLLREIHYLAQPPFDLRLPGPGRELLRNTNVKQLRVTATRLDTITSKYNTVMKTITDYELPLFERSLAKIDSLFEQGLRHYTWKTEESADFIETATALVCVDLHRNLDVVQTNCQEIAELTLAWSQGVLDVFASRDPVISYQMEKLMKDQAVLNEDFENFVVPSGNRIHTLLDASFKAVGISEASPAWQDYVDFVDAIVLEGLKQTSLASLKSMLNQIVRANMPEDPTIPVLTIRLELIENQVAFRPPLDESTSCSSVQETVQEWLQKFLARGQLVSILGGKGSYADYIAVDEEVQALVSHIEQLVSENAEECKKLYDLFADYAFLWHKDVNQTFQEFLHGRLSPNPIRESRANRSAPSNLRRAASAQSNSRASSAKSSIASAGLVGTAEKSFLNGRQLADTEDEIPSLDEFDTEIDIYRTARDDITGFQEFQDVGWLRVDLRPIKQVLLTYASKWMWVFTKYLSDQVSGMLEKLDEFLKRTEPEIEGITGEERDTASFMKMMRLFNEVSAQQSEMDGKFAAMHRTVLLVKKYGQKLPENTQKLFDAAPSRWNSLKTKVSLAKQRLGPRIQEESERITQDLEAFGKRVKQLHHDLEASEVYSRDCSIGDAWVTIEMFQSRLAVLDNEAQDLIELQELLEANVVNFALLPQCNEDLVNLKQVWETVRVIDDQQAEWKRHRWQKMNTKFLRDETHKQLEIVRSLPEDAFTWDVYMGLQESITTIQACLPLIDDLSNPAMRTRHWKQLVRVTGGAIQIDNDTLKRMTLGELLSLGLQKHVDDVRAIVQRAVKDLSIEMSLKTYEEVWLSKIFELREHLRSRLIVKQEKEQTENNAFPDNQSELSVSESAHVGLNHRSSQLRAASRISTQSSVGRTRRTGSVSSLPASLMALNEENNNVLYLLTNTKPIFDELESHQVALQAMQSSSAAGSFLDEVLKWQKRLQVIEAVLTAWLQAQEKWLELEEVYSSPDVRQALSHDANLFAAVNRDFRLLMKASDKNPNVLQCCQRKNILPMLERMNSDLDRCRKTLLRYLERRRQVFPRFYFLSLEDVLHIVCNGSDVRQINVYINKLLEYVGRLAYEQQDDTEHGLYRVTAVCSALGERLELTQPIACEGAVEGWLASLVATIKSSLQQQMAWALGVEKAPPKEVTGSASPAPSSRSRKGSNVDSKKQLGKKVSDSKLTGQRGPRASSQDGARPEQDAAGAQNARRARSGGRSSWTFDHVAEVVYLATQIQLTKKITKALKQYDEGNQDAIQICITKLGASIKASIGMLKGMEEEKNEGRRSRMSTGKSESGSEAHSASGSRKLPPSRGSVGETAPLDNPTIPEETDKTKESSSAEDTMDLSALPVTRQEDYTDTAAAHEAEMAEEEATRQQLLPSQIHKISSLIALMAHYRDLLTRIQERVTEEGEQSTSFLWCSQLRYTYTPDTKAIHIQMLDSIFDYGFEYLGASTREVITPLTERVFTALSMAVKAHMGGLCMGPAGLGRLSLVKALSRSMGQPFYNVNCTKNTNSSLLCDIFKGFALTGAWLCLNSLTNLQPAVLSVCALLLSTILDAMRANKSSVVLQSEEIPLKLDGAIFSVVTSGITVGTSNPEELLRFDATISLLPRELLAQFRTVSILKPDLRLHIEVMLTSQGFNTAHELARKVMLLYDMGRQLIGTNTPMTTNTNHLAYNGSGGGKGMSLQVLKYVAQEAGIILDAMYYKRMELTELADIAGEAYEQGQQTETRTDGVHSNDQEESIAMVTALRNTFMPRLTDNDVSIFQWLVADLWPNVDVPMTHLGHREMAADAGDENEEEKSIMQSMRESKTGSKAGSRAKSRSQVETRQKSIRETLVLNTPMQRLATAFTDHYTAVDEELEIVEDIGEAIAIATSNLSLVPGAAFQARVMQLAELNLAHKTIIIAGPPGCGKSECIKTFALAERERGKRINIQSVFTKSLESQELLGYLNPLTKEWREGLVPALLRKFCVQSDPVYSETDQKTMMKILQLDGELDISQFELMSSILHSDGSIVLANNERIVMADMMRFIWETESLSSLAPSLLANVGVMCMSGEDVGWRMVITMWLERRPDSDRDIITQLCDQYLPPLMDYLNRTTAPNVLSQGQTTRHKRVIALTDEAMVNTCTTLIEALITSYNDLSEVELERYFCFALLWSFAGTLDVSAREPLSQWWRTTFDKYLEFPADGLVFDYVVDSESHEFVKFADMLPSYTGTPHTGISPEAFVHVVSSEQLLYLLGVLTDYGKPVMLVGENGSGKSSIVNERIRTVCSGEVAEVLSLCVNTNRFTTARLLYQRLDERLEWKHGRTYVPKGNKRLLCLVDDLNLAKVDDYNFQTAVELLRQHIDDGGFYDPDTHAWRYIKNVTYVSTINPHPTAQVPPTNPRLLRHFAVFGCPYPMDSELQTIFTTLLNTHFITPEMSSAMGGMSGSTAHHLGIYDDKVKNVIRGEEEALKSFLSLIVKVTLELQERLRGMFLPTAHRCHYIFSVKDLTNLFRNLCLSLCATSAKENMLLLWEHESEWTYGRRMVSEVDRDRYRQAFDGAVKKEFSNSDYIQLLTSREKPIFSNLVEQDSGLVTAGKLLGNGNNNFTDEELQTDLFRPMYDVKHVRQLLMHGVEEYNKTHPHIKLSLYRVVMEQVCRLARIISSPHEVSHSVLVGEGCPGRCTLMANLAANLCGFSVFRINPSPVSSATQYKMDTFKADLVAAYTRAGVKGERILFLVEEEDLMEEDFLVYLSEFMVNGDVGHLFSFEQSTTIINSIRTEVTQAGLTYTRDVAWEFFLNTVKKNFRVCLITSGGGRRFQRRCREYPSFTKNVQFIWFSHWSKRQLISHAAFHLRHLSWMNRIQRENIAHLLATMHMVLRQQDGHEMSAGQYSHITNTMYERFVERFVVMSNDRHQEVYEVHKKMSEMNKQVQLENSLALKLKKQLEHEKIVLEERKAGTIKILSQIGQDTAITEQQIRIVKAQMEKIQHLKKLLPEYQVAHERAVFKAIAIVGDTKKIVQEMNIESLSELRAMSKPVIDIEDLMAAIIMILKNPQADLTWQKGAKRQMANLERFIEELMSFDDTVLPETTLALVEPYLRKATFEPEALESKVNNSACGALCKWVIGVCRYNRMMISKVKPLYRKVEETTAAIDNAEHRMTVLDNKRKALEVRLADLAKSFEEATIDKNDQEGKATKMDKSLDTAAKLRKVLRREQVRIQQVIASLPQREVAIPGGVSMAAAFATYLGPYHYNFRRLMLTLHWPNCLRERGVPLVIDSVDEVRGRVVDWAIGSLKTASGASGVEIDENMFLDDDEEEEVTEEESSLEEEETGLATDEMTKDLDSTAIPDTDEAPEQKDEAAAETTAEETSEQLAPPQTEEDKGMNAIREQSENASDEALTESQELLREESSLDGQKSKEEVTAQDINEKERNEDYGLYEREKLRRMKEDGESDGGGIKENKIKGSCNEYGSDEVQSGIPDESSDGTKQRTQDDYIAGEAEYAVDEVGGKVEESRTEEEIGSKDDIADKVDDAPTESGDASRFDVAEAAPENTQENMAAGNGGNVNNNANPDRDSVAEGPVWNDEEQEGDGTRNTTDVQPHDPIDTESLKDGQSKETTGHESIKGAQLQNTADNESFKEVQLQNTSDNESFKGIQPQNSQAGCIKASPQQGAVTHGRNTRNSQSPTSAKNSSLGDSHSMHSDGSQSGVPVGGDEAGNTEGDQLHTRTQAESDGGRDEARDVQQSRSSTRHSRVSFDEPSRAAAKEEDEEEEEFYDDGGEAGELLSQTESGTNHAMPSISSEQYNTYVRSLVKLLVGETTLNGWVRKDYNPRQLENVAILYSSWQCPPLLVDPYGEGISYLYNLNHTMNAKKLVWLDMDTRSDPQVILSIEKCIMRGKPVLLENCTHNMDTMVMPLIQHCNAVDYSADRESRMIRYCGRRILCHPDFRLYLQSPQPRPNFSSVIASTTTMINFGTSNETLVDDLLTRAFALVRPELYVERSRGLKNNFELRNVLLQIQEKSVEQLRHTQGKCNHVFGQMDVDMIASLTDMKYQVAQQIKDLRLVLRDLDVLRDELFPLARRATLLYAIIRSLAAIQQEYQFTLTYFLELFDEAVGGEFPQEYTQNEDDNRDALDDASSETEEHPEVRYKSAGSQHDHTKDDYYSDDFESEQAGDQETENQPPAAEDTAQGDGEDTEGSEVEPEVEVEPDMQPQDPLALVDMPELPPLPTEGLEYNSLPDNQIKQLVDRLTSLVFQRIRQSLFEEHRTLFATMLCINIQEESADHFTEEEMSLLLQGNPGFSIPLSLADFEADPEVEPPQWLSKDKWEDILAMSVLPGALDSLCVQIATNSEAWQNWFISETPEKEPLPFNTQQEKDGAEGAGGTPDLGPLNDFHQLVLLRMLRPDRMPQAMASYTEKHLSLSLDPETDAQLATVLEAVKLGHSGVLVLTPPSAGQPSASMLSGLKSTIPAADTIQQLAKTKGATVEVVTIGEGNEAAVFDSLDSCERDQLWLVIDKLHLATDQLLNDLKYRLQHMIRRPAGEDDHPAGSCIWLISEPCGRLPPDLLQSLYILAWDSLEQMALAPSTEEKPTLTTIDLQNSLATILISLLQNVRKDVWQMLDQEARPVRTAAFGLALVQSLLMVRQLLGVRGISQAHPLHAGQLTTAIRMLSSPFCRESEVLIVNKLCKMLVTSLHGNLFCNENDQAYAEQLIWDILPRIINGNDETIMIGTIEIPVPPANVDPADYGTWFEEKTGGHLDTVSGLALQPSVERPSNEASGTVFLRTLERLYDAQNMDLGDIEASAAPEMDMLRLRTIIDSVTEQLPPLLELGDVPASYLAGDFDFPYHRPSIVSLVSAESTMMPESVGRVLLQECLWFNKQLCHIRQQLHTISESLLGGPEAFPHQLTAIIHSLNEEHVPAPWIHPNQQPSTHCLMSWQHMMREKHRQMARWVKQRMVPVFTTGQPTPASHGHLKSVWLGGLVNPAALFTALRQEKAIASKCYIDEVVLTAEVSISQLFEAGSPGGDNDSGILLTNLHLQGAAWDMQNGCLTHAPLDINPLPSVYVYPVLKSARPPTPDGVSLYECPVFMNKARQVCPLTLPLASTRPADIWALAGTAILLDPGVGVDAAKKSRAYTLPKAGPLTNRILETASASQHSGQAPPAGPQDELEGAATERSEEQSQMSYKPMSPKASPLPPGLQMQREPPVNQVPAEQEEQGPPVNQTTAEQVQQEPPVNQATSDQADCASAGSGASRLSKQSTQSQRSNRSGKLQTGAGSSAAAGASPAARSPQLKDQPGSQGSLRSHRSHRSQQKQ